MPDTDNQLVYLDPFLVDRLRVSKGLSRKELAAKVNLRYGSVKEIFDQGGLYPANAKRLATFLGADVLDLLAPWDARYQPPANQSGPATGSAEWECAGYVDQGRQAPNGLYVIACRMVHRHTQGRLGRGKYYHLSWLSTKAKDEMRHKLSRHADVCHRVGQHPHLALNLVSTPAFSGDGWWVIDEWVGEKTLQSLLDNGGCPKRELPRLLHEIAIGMDALHRVEIVLREIAPSRVLLAEKDGRVVLTDFELAKLLDGSPSVSSDWPEDPFRAPEIDGGSATVASDLFSFGQVALAACGGLPGQLAGACSVFTKVGMPKKLAQTLENCLQESPSDRPQAVASLLDDLARWRRK